MSRRRGNRCAMAQSTENRGKTTSTVGPLPGPEGAVHERVGKKRGPRVGPSSKTARRERTTQDFVAGCTPGLSLKNCLFSSMKFFH